MPLSVPLQIVIPSGFIVTAREATRNSVSAWGTCHPSLILVVGPHMPITILGFRKDAITVVAEYRLCVVLVVFPEIAWAWEGVSVLTRDSGVWMDKLTNESTIVVDQIHVLRRIERLPSSGLGSTGLRSRIIVDMMRGAESRIIKIRVHWQDFCIVVIVVEICHGRG